VLALIYAWATPIFEASDELWHFGVVNHIANTGELPVQIIGVETPWEQEGSQPPLYYLIAAALVAPIDRSDFDATRQPNPHAIAGIPGAVGNKNLVLHDTPHSPLAGTALAVYVARLFSIALSVVTVYAVYRSACIVGDGDRIIALLAAGLTAFNPMFLFITGSVNNDNLVTALNSLVVWHIFIMLQRGFENHRSVVLGLLLGLTAISKLSGLVLVPVVALAALWAARRTGNWRGLVTFGALTVLFLLVLAGWWYARNLSLYGEFFGTRMMAEVAGVREGGFTLQTMLSEFQGFRFGYWGVFGAFNIMTFRWFYDVMDVITLLAAVGLTLHLWRRRVDRDFIFRVGLLTLIVVIGSVGVIAWTAQTYASQGRLLFPYVAATSSLMAVGLTNLPPLPPLHGMERGRTAFSVWIGVTLFGAFALIVPFASIAPQYVPPAPLAALPDTARQVYARYGDVALIGYESPDLRYQQGDTVPITLYWQVLDRSTRDLSLYLNAVVGDGDVIGKVDSYPGAGRLRTTTWQPGAIYADTYGIPLDTAARGQSQLRIQVGCWFYPSEDVIAPVGEDGQPLGSVLLDGGAFVSGESEPIVESLTETERVHFGGLITLLGYTFEVDELTLVWEASGTPMADYTVFVQLVDDDNSIIGQGDAPPQLPTRYWLAGERFETRHTITYTERPASGTYRIIIGWYRPDTFERLATNAPDNAYPLTEISMGRQ
jgi:4-amino-4-deoxy-L-arabinose transferase-like glycosyltransferase